MARNREGPTGRPARGCRPSSATGRASATRMTTGTSRTTPTSKNSGIPRMNAISAIIHGSFWARPGDEAIDDRIRSAGSCNSFRSSPHQPADRPHRWSCQKPPVKLVTTSLGDTPAVRPMDAGAEDEGRGKGCHFATLIRMTTTAINEGAAVINCPFPAVVRGSVASARARPGPHSFVEALPIHGDKVESGHRALDDVRHVADDADDDTRLVRPRAARASPNWLGSRLGGISGPCGRPSVPRSTPASHAGGGSGQRDVPGATRHGRRAGEPSR